MTADLTLTVYTVEPPEPQGQDVLLVHGFATTPALCWEQTRWVRTLSAAGYRLHLVALPGHQDAQPPADWQASATLPLPVTAEGNPVQDAADVLAGYLSSPVVQGQDGHTRSVHLLGFSLGARLVWELALRHGHLAATVTAGGMPLGNHMPDFARLLEDGHTSENLEAGQSHPAPVSQPVLLNQLRAMLASTPVPALALRALASLPYTPLTLDRLPACPALLFTGEKDPLAITATDLTPAPGSNTLEHHVEPRRDHISVLTSGRVRTRVTDFLTRHPAS